MLLVSLQINVAFKPQTLFKYSFFLFNNVTLVIIIFIKVVL